jgi:glucosylceramidase
MLHHRGFQSIKGEISERVRLQVGGAQPVITTVAPPAIPAQAAIHAADQCSGQAAILWQTSQDGDRITNKPGAQIEGYTEIPEGLPVVEVQVNARDQMITGFGGAFTEAAATQFATLGADVQEQVLEQYFGPTGLGFTMGRVHINSCDFSTGSYSFDDTDGDYNLEQFDMSVGRDTTKLIPLIQRAMAKVQQNGQSLKLLASPWSPPAWMKKNGEMDHSWSPGLKPECRAAWALYFGKWITAYAQHNVPIWAVTIQNEPEADQVWESCLFTAAEEAEFLGNFLGPALRAAHPDVKIFVHDHNKDHIQDFANAVHSHPNASRYFDGVAFHWYAGDFFENVAAVHSTYPTVTLLASEATYEISHFQPPGSKTPNGGWVLGEGYAHDIIGDLNAGATGWIDWNLMLGADGGPNHVGNMCEAPIIVNGGQAIQHEQYWFMGQFSKFVLPGSYRLQSTVSNTPRYSGPVRPYGACTGEDGLESAAFVRPDNQVVVVALNCGDAPIDFAIRLTGHPSETPAVTVSIPAHAIQTYVFPSQCGGVGQTDVLDRAARGMAASADDGLPHP